MKIIVGLGNPGEKFKNTRHNVGFLVLDKLKNRISNFQFQKKLQAEICQIGEILLVKPQTFMNSSGVAVKKILQYNNITVKQCNNLYVIHDDLDLPLGEYKIQFGRGAAGHHGVESVINHLKSQDFWRVRIGINNKLPDDKMTRLEGQDYVLGKFSKKEKEVLDKVLEEVGEELIKRWQKEK